VTNGLGSGVDIIMRTALHRHGLEVRRDYTMIEAPFPTHKAMLKEHKGDLVVGVLPFSYDPGLKEFAKPLFTTQSSLGRIALSFWAARKTFIDKNVAALLDLLEDYGTMLRWFYDPANHEEAVEIVARFLKRPPVLEDWLFTKKDFYRDLDGKPDLKVIQESIEKVKELGFMKETVDASKYADLSLIEEATRRLGNRNSERLGAKSCFRPRDRPFQPVFEHAIGSDNKCYSNLTSRQLEPDPGRPDKRLRPMP
jgi:NitT/TauT family transport system substrate-binding protein